MGLFEKSVVAIVALAVFLTTECFAQVPCILNYQGRVIVSGTNVTATGQFKFALVDGAGSRTFWSNDGTGAGEPSTFVSVPVAKGLYSVLLGQSPMVSISPNVFTNSDVRLRVWFDSGSGMQRMTPDQRIGAVGYALIAATVTNGAIDSVKLAADAASLAKVSGGAMSVSGANVGIGTTNLAERLEVAGRLVIADSTNASPKAGTIRWTGTDFQGHDGAKWLSLTMPAPAGMALVPGGTFTMGSAALGLYEAQWWPDITNYFREHQVTLSPFYIGKYEVTYGVWYSVRQRRLQHLS